MLKIRISGSENELRQIAHKVGTTQIKRFKRDNGKTTFALDVQISVESFLQNLDLSDSQSDTDKPCDPHEIQAELEDLLKEISD